jgi:hypothetical protein
VVRSGPQAVSEEKHAGIVTGTERVKNTPCICMLKLPILVDLQQIVRELVLSITSCPSIIISENIVS